MTTNSNTAIYDSAVDRAAMIRLYENRVSNKVNLILDGHVVRTDKLIREAKLSTKGFLQLQEAIDQELLRTHKQTFRTTKRSLLDLFTDQASFMYQNVETVMGKIWRTKRPTRRVAEEVVLEQPLHGNRTLAQGWSGISKGEKIRLESVIRKGIADGLTANEIALNVRKGNVHNITRNQSKALVVTSITSVYAQADHQIYVANADSLRGWQYVAVLDARTTPICSHRDGTIYPVSDTKHLPPAHYYCRSHTIPVFKSWEDIGKLEGVAQVRRRNLQGLTKEQIAFYDGQTPLRESYSDWLVRQPNDVQLKHLGDYTKVGLFQSGELPVDRFVAADGTSIGIKELRKLTSVNTVVPGDTLRFANAREKLDAMQLYATSPDDIINDVKLQETLKDYYLLQSRDLDGTLSLTNFRGKLIPTKQANKARVLLNPPTEEQMVFNPITNKYDDVRLYQPVPEVLRNNLRLVRESDVLLPRDKEFIEGFANKLSGSMSSNEIAVITDNLRVTFGRQRVNKDVWTNLKAVLQSQIKFDVMNVSDSIETVLRKDADVLKKLLLSDYIDPVLGKTQLDDLSKNFISNILARNKWEDAIAPKIATELRGVLDADIPLFIKSRLSEDDIQQFYLKFTHRLSLADSPDRDQVAVSLGRDLYNLANLNGDRRAWFNTGMRILDSKRVSKFFEIETFGVQKRRMKSRMSGSYFGPYYDALSYNIKVVDPRIQEYAKLSRKVEVGLRVGVTDDRNRLVFREGYKTYFIDRGILGFEDTRIPITSTSSFSDFPSEFIDKNMVDALNWASNTKYRVDTDFYDFINNLLYFQDDKGKAKHYSELNEYKKYIAERGDAYERFKSMSWLRASNKSFSNHPFIDHRARIYDRGFISPQSGESFRPFLNTEKSYVLGVDGFLNLQDQVGSFLGGLSDYFEGNYNSLTFSGRQKIAEKWRPELVKIGNAMIRRKPNDIRMILDSDINSRVDGEELGKFYRFAIEIAKVDNHLGSQYKDLSKMAKYETALALEQDASSSGAQIIALTTRNKQLAELSNVVPTTQKKRLYDEIAAATFNDPRFKALNEKLGLNEKDLRKASKAQNMVTFYGAGQRTGILNVEGKLAKVLGKEGNTLVVRASERETVLNEISARMARYEKFDPETAAELKILRNNVKDIFNKGLDPGQDIMEQLYFLDSKTKELVEKMSRSYDRIVTPQDFAAIAKLMSEHLSEQVPILKDFTRFYGRLAEAYLVNAKPSQSAFDWSSIVRGTILGTAKNGYTLPDSVSRLLGLKAGEPLSEKLLKRLGFWKPDSTLHDILYGVTPPETRRTGGKFFKIEIAQVKKLFEIELFKANKLPKSWTNVPSVNFDGKTIEQNFTQTFEEKLLYKNPDGQWTTNILQIPQKTEATWWEEVINKDGKINDIADATKARTAFGVNANHSNDAVIVKHFHLWGKKANIPTSTIHDAFFANAAQMLEARRALRGIYADMLTLNVIEATLLEMKNRGFPKELYEKFRNEAIAIGLIPKAGVSVVGGKRITDSDILKIEDILKPIKESFKEDLGFYGVG